MAQPEIVVVAGLIWRGPRLLVQQRPANRPRGLLWEFPGGKVEAGETDAAALLRECEEELGVRAAAVGRLAWQTQHAYPDLTVRLRLYHMGLGPDAVPEPRQARQLAWLTAAELVPLAFCAADVPLVAALAAGQLLPEAVACGPACVP